MTQIKDGGPAFPEPVAIAPAGDVYPAYGGMTLRDWFAGQALAGTFRHIGWINTIDGDQAEVGKRAYLIADAMLAAREVKP